MSGYITKKDLDEFEQKIKEQHETRIQMISGHYSHVLKSNQELTQQVCSTCEKVDTLITQLQPILDAQKVVVSLHAFLKWIGLPFTAVGFFVWWMWTKITT